MVGGDNGWGNALPRLRTAKDIVAILRCSGMSCLGWYCSPGTAIHTHTHIHSTHTHTHAYTYTRIYTHSHTCTYANMHTHKLTVTCHSAVCHSYHHITTSHVAICSSHTPSLHRNNTSTHRVMRGLWHSCKAFLLRRGFLMMHTNNNIYLWTSVSHPKCMGHYANVCTWTVLAASYTCR